jgi:hypothetical protein
MICLGTPCHNKPEIQRLTSKTCIQQVFFED